VLSFDGPEKFLFCFYLFLQLLSSMLRYPLLLYFMAPLNNLFVKKILNNLRNCEVIEFFVLYIGIK
jgi:hypothetical protein